MSTIGSVATPRVGIIGLGSIGHTHIEAWQANGITPVSFFVAGSVDINSPSGLFCVSLHESDYGRLWHCSHSFDSTKGCI
jgi:predicted dehydrogenase